MTSKESANYGKNTTYPACYEAAASAYAAGASDDEAYAAAMQTANAHTKANDNCGAMTNMTAAYEATMAARAAR